MRYQFLETKIVNRQEIAYVLDTETGVVYRSPIQDFTNKGYAEEEVQELPVPRRRILRRPTVPVYDEYETEEAEQIPKNKDLPAVRPVMIPPGLAGVFKQPDEPGAAVETRRV